MNRTSLPNPHDSTKTVNRWQLNEDEMKTWIGDTGVNAVPVGFRAFIRCSGNMVEWGIEKLDGNAPAPDKIAGKSQAELQTMCAMKGIKYAKGDSVAALQELLKAKG